VGTDSKNREKRPLPLGWRGKTNTVWIQNCTHSHYFSTIQANVFFDLYSTHQQVRIEIAYNFTPIDEPKELVYISIIEIQVPSDPDIRLEGDVIVPVFTRHFYTP